MARACLTSQLSVKGDEFATQMMGMVDKNGDGVVDFEEFCAAFKEIPDFGGLVSAECVAPPAVAAVAAAAARVCRACCVECWHHPAREGLAPAKKGSGAPAT